MPGALGAGAGAAPRPGLRPHASDYGVREGLVTDWLRWHARELSTMETADGPAACAACSGCSRVSTAYGTHPRHVATLSLQLFDELAPVARLRRAGARVAAVRRRCSTTWARPSATTATRSTRRTSSATAACAGSPRRRSRSWRWSPATTADARPKQRRDDAVAGCASRPPHRAAGSRRCCASPKASTAATTSSCVRSVCGSGAIDW